MLNILTKFKKQEQAKPSFTVEETKLVIDAVIFLIGACLTYKVYEAYGTERECIKGKKDSISPTEIDYIEKLYGVYDTLKNAIEGKEDLDKKYDKFGYIELISYAVGRFLEYLREERFYSGEWVKRGGNNLKVYKQCCNILYKLYERRVIELEERFI